MIYLLTKDSTLHAADNKELIGALPVVNAEEVGFLIEGSTILLNEEGLSRLKLFARPGETVALPGWALEKESHFTLLYHRLVRSEPEKPKKYEPFPQISELSEFESDKPENSAHGYTEGSEVIGNLNLGMDSMVIGSKNVEPSESQEETVGIVTKGQFIDLTTVAEHAHSEGKKEGWNEAIEMAIARLKISKAYLLSEQVNELQKLRK